MNMRVFALLLACTALLTAQTNRGGISGTVFDPTGAVIPNASVTVRNLGTNQEVRVKTSEAGTYSVLSLEPVTYTVTVEAPGFKKEVVNEIKVDTATVAAVSVTLQAGDVATQVTVEAEVAQVNTESGTTSTTVNERQIQDIPLVNRSVLDLAMTQPNVMGGAGSEDPGLTAGSAVPGFNLSVNGGRPGSTLLMADGANNTGVSLARTMVSFSPETVQEFTVQTSAYSAEYSQSGGGIDIAAENYNEIQNISGGAALSMRCFGETVRRTFQLAHQVADLVEARPGGVEAGGDGRAPALPALPFLADEPLLDHGGLDGLGNLFWQPLPLDQTIRQ